jgi:hypothetical protein
MFFMERILCICAVSLIKEEIEETVAVKYEY